MVSNASDDFPEPLTPVTTMSLLRGRSIETFLRLCCLAPRTAIVRRGEGVESTSIGDKTTGDDTSAVVVLVGVVFTAKFLDNEEKRQTLNLRKNSRLSLSNFQKSRSFRNISVSIFLCTFVKHNLRYGGIFLILEEELNIF